MLPVLTPSQMTEVDAAATDDVDVLIRRAAGAVARTAVQMMGGTYGRRVVVVAGPGNNGNDGRVAAELLRGRGVRVILHDVGSAPAVLDPADLVIDAAFGTGFRGSYSFPDPNGAPVLAVDIPSGISGSTGAMSGSPARAATTVTFAALKPGLLLGDGPACAGNVVIADIGLDVVDPIVVGEPTCSLVTDADVLDWVPSRVADDHKWRHAVWVVGGSAGMAGAPALCAAAALRAGAGYVRLSVPDGRCSTAESGGGRDSIAAHGVPIEAVVVAAAEDGWAAMVATDARRFGCIAVGPGLGRSDAAVGQVREALASVNAPIVLDGDGLWAISDSPIDTLARRATAHGSAVPTVLTPHDGEFMLLTGGPPGEDRIEAARGLAADTGAVVLLKGPTTVVADPVGQVLLVRSGDARLATAGTGDVLTGTIAALIASGAPPLHAAAAGAQLHGRAAMLGAERGLVASDVAAMLPAAWDSLAG